MIKKVKSILSNEVVYLGSDILIKAIAFLSLPLFVNKMSTTDFGEFSLYITYMSFLGVFFGLNIHQGIVRYYIDKEKEDKYLTTAIWIVSINSLVLSSIILLIEKSFNITGIPVNTLYILLVSTLFGRLMQIGLENIRGMFKAYLYGFFSILSSVLSTFLGLILVYQMPSDLGFWRLVSMTIPTILIGVIMIAMIVKRDGTTFNKSTAKYLLVYSIPLIPYTFSTTIISQIDRIFIANISLSDVGIYSFASNLAMIMQIVAISLNRAFQPFFFKSIRDNDNYKKRMLQNTTLFLIIYTIFIYFNEILIYIFGNDEFSEATGVIPVIVLGYGFFFLYSLVVNFLYYYKKNYLISAFSMISAGIILILNSILVPKYSYFGAAWATVCSFFILFIVSFIYVRKKLKIEILPINTIIFMILAIISIALTKIIFNFLY